MSCNHQKTNTFIEFQYVPIPTLVSYHNDRTTFNVPSASRKDLNEDNRLIRRKGTPISILKHRINDA